MAGTEVRDALRPRLLRMKLVNFLSFGDADVEFADLTVLVGPNSAGKSNAVAALKLLHDIPLYGLPAAVARRGGFDQLRHRSMGRPFNPMIRLEFRVPGSNQTSFYEIKFKAEAGKRYSVSREHARLNMKDSEFWFDCKAGNYISSEGKERERPRKAVPIPTGQSCLPLAGDFCPWYISQMLSSIAIVEVNASAVGELQAPSSIREFESDGSNAASIFESLGPRHRSDVINQLAAIVPNIADIEVRRFADRITLVFRQSTSKGNREFLVKQMSDGTKRAFAIVLALTHSEAASLVVIEEPEMAIHLGALSILVDLFTEHASQTPILLTTHSADMIDLMPLESIRVVWSNDGASKIARLAPHTVQLVQSGLSNPGELLKLDSLDPLVTA